MEVATFDSLRHRRIGIIEIAPIAGTPWAQLHTSRLLPPIDEILTERALLHRAGRMGRRIELADLNLKIILRVVANQTANTLVGTSLDARLTPNSQISIDEHDTVFSLLGRAGGARAQASRLRAMLALHRQEVQRAIGEGAASVVVGKSAARHGGANAVKIVIAFGVHNVVRQLLRQIVRHFARRSARLASNATTKVDRHSVSSHLSQPP